MLVDELEALRADLRKLRSQMTAMDNVVSSMEGKLAELFFKKSLLIVRTETQTKGILEQLRATALAEFDLTLNEFMSADRYRWLQPARQLFCLAAVKHSISLGEIANFLNRHHSTVMYSCQKAMQIMEREPRLVSIYQRILQSVVREIEVAS